VGRDPAFVVESSQVDERNIFFFFGGGGPWG
jgi:hypothetical protein